MAKKISDNYIEKFHLGRYMYTPGRRHSKTLILSANIDKKNR